MVGRVVIVGSGPSGVHFALSVLRKGYSVTLIDVGHQRPQPIKPQDSFTSLKMNLPDPAEYFLGEQYDGVLLPNADKEYYGIPPNKGYVFRAPNGFAYRSQGFEPLFS